MHWPSLPRPGKSRRPTGRSSLGPFIAAPLLLLFCLVVSFFLFFPTQALKDRIELEAGSAGPVVLEMGDLGLRFPPTLRASDIRVVFKAPRPQTVDIDTATVSPLWSTLVGGNPGFAFRTDLMEGELDGDYRRSGETHVEAHGIVLDRALPLTGDLQLRLMARLNQGELSAVLPPRDDSASHVDLAFSQVRLAGLEAFGLTRDVLNAGDISLQASGTGRSLKIERATATGGDIELSATGTLFLAYPVDRSRLNLQVTIRPAASLDSQSRDLLQMLIKPEKDGTSRLRIVGTLARPRVR